VSVVQTRFPVPLSIRACNFAARGSPMIFLTWLRSPRVANGATQTVPTSHLALLDVASAPNAAAEVADHLATLGAGGRSRPDPGAQ
jgi:hypothetical protein